MKKSRQIGALRATAIVAAIALGLAACGSSGAGGQRLDESISAEGVDDGTGLTLWTRAPLAKQAKLLVDAYNASHENQVKLTIVPNDDYVAKVGAAAGSGGLPDLFAADIVYVPNWADQGLFRDISAQYDHLDYKDQINQGHVEAGTNRDGKQHVLPFVLDLSVIFYNKDLYKKAGLDPEKGPTTLKEFAEQAKAVAKLGRGVDGTYFGGNCGGCLVFTWFPSIWAAGGDVMNADGTESNLANAPATDVYAMWKDLVDSGAVGSGSRDETGATWVAGFQEGKVGVMPYPATLLSTAEQTVDVGVAPIPGPDGGESTFVGGDGIGISKDSQHDAQAWNFLSWLMSEEAQVQVLAKNGDVTARADFASNEYSEKDPRLVTINEVASKGKTPIAKNFQEAFNAPNSPWVSLVRDAVFGDGSAVSSAKAKLDSVLRQ